MAKAADAVLPILRNIQKDLAGLKKDVGELRTDFRAMSEQLEAFERYFTYEMGLTSRNQSDIKRLQGQIRSLEDRVDTIEP